MAKPKKWVVLAAAPDQLTAEMWKDILLQQGIPAMINPEDNVSFLGVSGFPCRLMVAPDYLNQAKEILTSLQTEEQA